MARNGWTERNRWNISETNIQAVCGHTDMTTNPAHQYSLGLQAWDGDCLVEVSVPVRFSWRPEQESLRPEGQGWDHEKLAEYWDCHLHEAETIAVRLRGGLIRRKGKGKMPVAPSVAARRTLLAQQEAARRAEEKARRDEISDRLAEQRAKEREEFYSALPKATSYTGFSGCKRILKVEGQGPSALITLEREEEPIEARWLEGAGIKSLRFD